MYAPHLQTQGRLCDGHCLIVPTQLAVSTVQVAVVCPAAPLQSWRLPLLLLMHVQFCVRCPLSLPSCSCRVSLLENTQPLTTWRMLLALAYRHTGVPCSCLLVFCLGLCVSLFLWLRVSDTYLFLVSLPVSVCVCPFLSAPPCSRMPPCSCLVFYLPRSVRVPTPVCVCISVSLCYHHGLPCPHSATKTPWRRCATSRSAYCRCSTRYPSYPTANTRMHPRLT